MSPYYYSLYLKWTRKGRVPSYQGGTPIPYRKWTKRVTDPILCERGWHACRWEDATQHISDELWVCELDGQLVVGDDKVAGGRLRIVRRVDGINERTLRLFAADCAEDVLHLFERERPNDNRPRLAIQAARDFAEGRITAAARAAAWDAAWDAAGAAAGAAARTAAGAAARTAAGAAAGAAAWAAAWDATGAAAWDATGAAARAAAWAAARAAAWAAARDAAGAAQTDRLLVHYGGLDPAGFARREAQP